MGQRFVKLTAAAVALSLLTGAARTPRGADPDNPSCPRTIDWGPQQAMTLTAEMRGGKKVLIANGIIDGSLPARLRSAIEADDQIEEIWLRSMGGDARSGNQAGRVIRSFPGMTTRIPAGWGCFSACNFVFMGGDRRFVEPGGLFIVHMFTHTSNREAIDMSVEQGSNSTAELIGEIEQSSALLASEDNDFLIRMGISRKLLTDIMYKQQAVQSEVNKSTRYCLSQEEVRLYNVQPVERSE